MIERVIAQRRLAGRVLDYGAGIGQLTRRLLARKRFDRVTAADILPAPVDLEGCVEWIGLDLNELMTGRDGAFDVVIAAEVIEHLENPRLMMREIFRILSPGGTAIITAPNNESWRSLLALLIRGHYVAFGDASYPAHITPLLRRDLTRVFWEAQFPTPEFHFTNEGGIPGKPVITWQQVSLGLLRGIRFSDNVLAVAKKPAEVVGLKLGLREHLGRNDKQY
jgi:2-polyprenyl-3-methyl-5-hydroxy-6-metoxy-1,4-benzoquinol methylase